MADESGAATADSVYDKIYIPLLQHRADEAHQSIPPIGYIIEYMIWLH
jgi:hypothetical protein